MDRLDRQFDFIREIDKEKTVERRSYISDGSRREDDAEHAWHIALMCVLLSEYSRQDIDVLKTVTMLLVHDLVEIDAGDTFAYDTEGRKTKDEREKKGADRLFAILPDDQGQMLRSLWEEFEARQTPEAVFAHAMDNIEPLMLNAATDGRLWQENNVRLSQILTRNEITPRGSKELWDYAYENFIRPNTAKGRIADDTKPAD